LQDVVEIDHVLFEKKRRELTDFCLSIPGTELGLSWRQLRPYTGDNGFLAKTLIALGDLLEVWSLHPNPDMPTLWHDTMYPMILADSVQRPSRHRVPKPSTGDLERTIRCETCQRDIPAPGAAADPVECDNVLCEHEHVVRVPQGKTKTAAKASAPTPELNAEEFDPQALERFLRNINH